ncbi:hypothetical protein ABN584_12460 [Gloeocapsa sp. BRSZ]
MRYGKYRPLTNERDRITIGYYSLTTDYQVLQQLIANWGLRDYRCNSVLQFR